MAAQNNLAAPAPHVSVNALRGLVPLDALTPARLRELAEVSFVERVAGGVDAFRVRGPQGQSVYVLKGELELTLIDGTRLRVAGGSEPASHALGRRGATVQAARATVDSEIVRIDDDLLDIMVTWDQLAGSDLKGLLPSAQTAAQPTVQSAAPARPQPAAARPATAAAPIPEAATDWSVLSGVFSMKALNSGPLSQLPPAHIDELLRRFKRVKAKRGDVIVQQGAEGDFYYLIESGRCDVTREIGGAAVPLAEIKGGDAFGEEALVSGARRNATVTMKSDGVLLRLPREDFIELLKQPLLNRVSYSDAQRLVAGGAKWLDVRYPSEYQYDRLEGAINVPLSEIRNAFGLLNAGEQYVVYCQTGTRSSAAAFLLAQRGYRASLLERGLAGAARQGRAA
jgi:rhodanese-related sulfurtransferase